MNICFRLPAFSIKTERQKQNLALAIWVLITVFCVVQSLLTHRYNNYLIFENTVRNLFAQQSFYADYPQFHFDSNHYGPVFSVFFMPFAAFPNAIGFLLWNVFNCLLLFKALAAIPVKKHSQLYFIAIPCFAAASLSQQFNPAAAAFIILSYTQLNKHKGFWSAMFIMLGAFIKLYGIVGLAFFFFVKDKKRFVLYLLLWAAVLFVLPMLFASPAFIVNSYREWVVSLIHKNANNIAEASTDISIMGFIRTAFTTHAIPNSVFLIIGIGLFGLPYLNFKAYKKQKFQLYLLASVLLFPVLFSTGSEDCTYIIAIAGVGLWHAFAHSDKLKRIVFVVICVFSCDFPLLLFPKVASAHPVLLSMMSVPFFMVWLLIIYEAATLKKEEPNFDDQLSGLQVSTQL